MAVSKINGWKRLGKRFKGKYNVNNLFDSYFNKND